jgi:ABC-type amino acid transport substrate-binding protein
MGNMKWWGIFAGILILLLGKSGWAVENEWKTVSVLTLEDYSPFCSLTSDVKTRFELPPGKDTSNFVGYSWDVLRESYHLIGYTIILTVSPWARSMHDVKSGYGDILFPTGKNAERLKIFHYSEEPINHANFVVYVRQDNPIVWDGLKSLKGLKIGVKRGFNYGDKWNSADFVEKKNVDKIIQGFKMLDAKRLDGFLGYEFNWDYLLDKIGWTQKYRKLPVFEFSYEYLVALKSNPRALQLLKDFDTGKRMLIQSGRLNAIKEKWFGKP